MPFTTHVIPSPFRKKTSCSAFLSSIHPIKNPGVKNGDLAERRTDAGDLAS